MMLVPLGWCTCRTGEFVVLVKSEDVSEEAILFDGVLAPRIRDVLDFARES